MSVHDVFYFTGAFIVCFGGLLCVLGGLAVLGDWALRRFIGIAHVIKAVHYAYEHGYKMRGDA